MNKRHIPDVGGLPSCFRLRGRRFFVEYFSQQCRVCSIDYPLSFIPRSYDELDEQRY